MARNDPQANLRIPADLKDALVDAAKAGNRSMNAEIVSRLQFSFHPEDVTLSEFTTGELVEELMNRFPPGMVEIRIGKVEDEAE